MNISETWDTCISRIIGKHAGGVTNQLSAVLMMRLSQVSAETAEFLSFVDSKGNDVQPMPSVEDAEWE